MNWTIDLYVCRLLEHCCHLLVNFCDLQLAMLANAGEDVMDSFIHYVMTITIFGSVSRDHLSVHM